ncbi:hypothetical protein V2G26_012778 [Clonostachys chloroleuca]
MALNLAVELTAPNGVKYSQPTGLFINNQWVASSNGEKLTTLNPANDQQITSVSAATEQDVDTAVKSARKALQDSSWCDLCVSERGKLINRLADLIEEHRETIAAIETWDNGKPYTAALNEDVAEVVQTLRYYGGFSDKIFGQVIETTPGKLAYTIRDPVGVCGQIIPWNYPLAMAAWKLGPALACGNTVVLKPAEQTPLSILYLANLIPQAGFPPGVINVLNGLGRVAGAALAAHEDVDKIAFTGSTATGKVIMKLASSNLKSITLETGGKSPLIVFDDADLDLASYWAHAGIMSNQGQICTATSRILVQDGIYDQFLAKFLDQVRAISKVGDPFDESTYQGPQITKAQQERIVEYVKIGQDEGARLELGAKPFQTWATEVFGPFVVITRFSTEKEAVQLANGTIYGLGSAIFTSNLALAHRTARKIEAGMVWINSSQDSDWRIPFGGVKQSGIGRELGEAGLAAYSNIKAVHVNLNS